MPKNRGMSTVPEWVKALNISLSDVQEWQKIVTDPKELLLWAVENRAIDEAKYLEWAKNHYGIAVIKQEFFKIPAPLQLWKKYVMGPWRADLIPISEWNGTLFVACLEPQEINMGGLKTQYLLSSLKPLKAWWEIYQDLNKGEYTVMANVVAKQAQQVKVQTPNVVPPPTATPTEKKSDLNATPGSQNTSMPEGLNVSSLGEITKPSPSLNFQAGNIEDLMQKALQEKIAQEEKQASESLQMPDGLNLSVESTLSSPTGPIGLKMPTSNVEEETKTSKKSLDLEAITPPEKVSPSPTPPTPMPQPSATQPTPQQAPSRPVPPPPPSKAQWPLNAINSAEKPRTDSSMDPYVKQLFQDMKNHFEQCIIFKLQGDHELTPWHWDINLPIDATLSPVIDLSQASIFKIVVETKMPYHGYVRPSTPNDLFFRRWNQGHYPEHISVFPMISDRGFHGLVVGMTTKEKGLEISLTQYQNSVDRMVSGLIQTQKLAAA